MTVVKRDAQIGPDKWSEFAAKPSAVIVHDPVSHGGFDLFDSLERDEELETRTLFRTIPDATLYQEQHRGFVDLVRDHITQVIYLSDLIDREDLSRSDQSLNLVFKRDSIITLPWVPGGYVPARLKPPLRREETRVMEGALRRLGLEPITTIRDDVFLEGGDVVPFELDERRILLVGFGPRTTLSGVECLRERLVPECVDAIVAVELAPWRMNLDGGLLPVADDVVLSDRQSIVRAFEFDSRGTRHLDLWGMFRSHGFQVIETSRQESVFSQSCNCLCLGDRTIIYYDLCDRVASLLRDHGVIVHVVPGSELVKGRGGPRCMSRPVYRE